MENEEWRRVVIDDHEFNYEISNLGNIRRFDTKRPLKFRISTHGYYRVHICDASINYCKDKMIHQLVMNAFNSTDDNSLEINHKNGNRQDNRLSNLEWVTHQQNIHHAVRTGLLRSGAESPNSKYSEEQIMNACEMLQEGIYTYKEISEMTGVKRNVMYKLKKKSQWKSVVNGYDFDEPIHPHDYTEIHNSLDRAIISGKSGKEMIDTLVSYGLTRKAANSLLYKRRKKIKEGKSIIQCSVYIDEGIEIFPERSTTSRKA